METMNKGHETCVEGKQPYFCPPRHIDDDSDLSPNEVLLLAVVSDTAGSWEETCWKSEEELAKITGWTTRTIRTHRRSLIEKGRIEKVGNALKVLPYTTHQEQEKEVYFIIPRELYEIGLVHKQHSRDFRVLMRIARRCGNGGVCIESIPNMAKSIGVGKDHICAALNRLEELQLIERRNRPNQTNELRMLPFPRRRRTWCPEDEKLIRKAASIMMEDWKQYPLKKGKVSKENLESIVNAIKHTLVEHTPGNSNLTEVLNGIIEGVREKVKYARRSRVRVYLNHFIRAGNWADPFNVESSCLGQRTVANEGDPGD